MHIRPGEEILSEIRRHKTPYFAKLSAVFILAFPVYFFLFKLYDQMSEEIFFGILAFISFFIGMIITIISMDYLLDRLIITDKRVVWVDWKSIFKRAQHETEFKDIQDIITHEKGILSKFKIFDYGLLEISTASSKICIIFNDCPNPEGVKHFVLTQYNKSKVKS